MGERGREGGGRERGGGREGGKGREGRREGEGGREGGRERGSWHIRTDTYIHWRKRTMTQSCELFQGGPVLPCYTTHTTSQIVVSPFPRYPECTVYT